MNKGNKKIEINKEKKVKNYVNVVFWFQWFMDVTIDVVSLFPLLLNYLNIDILINRRI